MVFHGRPSRLRYVAIYRDTKAHRSYMILVESHRVYVAESRLESSNCVVFTSAKS